MSVWGYRPDIDGLRTLAVLPVVLFHAGFSVFGGGYIGVDVFFVISGFLITSILMADAERGTASILSFYDRRIRRIFPALITVIFVTMIGCLFVMLPSELSTAAETAISAVLFCSNILFWKTTNYFSGAPYKNPLLHTWSLAVEEQFYILWPLVVFFVAKGARRKYLLPLTVLGMLISFGMAEFLVERSAKTAFYMFPPRAWELFAGAVLAMVPNRGIETRGGRQWASLAGAALLIAPIFLYEEGTRFPAAAAVPPVLGTVLLILANARQDTWVARLLGTRPMVGIGLVSYSLYLWHWPVISLFRLATGRPSTAVEAGVIVLVSLALAGLSWKYVEAPFRQVKRAHTRQVTDQKRVLAFGVASILAVLVTSGGVIYARGFPERLPSDARFVDSYPTAAFRPTVGCAVKDGFDARQLASCFRETPAEQRANALLWGDSHANAYALGLTEHVHRNGGELLTVIKNSCAPLPGAVPVAFSANNSSECAALNDAVLSEAAASTSIKTVIVAAYWGKFAQTDPAAGEEAGVSRFLSDARTENPSQANNLRVIRDSLDRAAAALDARRKRLVILKQAPSFPTSARKCLARARWEGADEGRCGVTAAQLTVERATLSAIFEEVATRHNNVEIVDPVPALCPDGVCAVAQGRFPLYRDAHHLSDVGSRQAAAAFPVELIAKP